MNILKGIAAVLAGVVFVFVTHAGTDLILESLGIFTPPRTCANADPSPTRPGIWTKSI